MECDVCKKEKKDVAIMRMVWGQATRPPPAPWGYYYPAVPIKLGPIEGSSDVKLCRDCIYQSQVKPYETRFNVGLICLILFLIGIPIVGILAIIPIPGFLILIYKASHKISVWKTIEGKIILGKMYAKTLTEQNLDKKGIRWGFIMPDKDK